MLSYRPYRPAILLLMVAGVALSGVACNSTSGGTAQPQTAPSPPSTSSAPNLGSSPGAGSGPPGFSQFVINPAAIATGSGGNCTTATFGQITRAPDGSTYAVCVAGFGGQSTVSIPVVTATDPSSTLRALYFGLFTYAGSAGTGNLTGGPTPTAYGFIKIELGDHYLAFACEGNQDFSRFLNTVVDPMDDLVSGGCDPNKSNAHLVTMGDPSRVSVNLPGGVATLQMDRVR
jgi:hypothetical protein